MWRMTYFLGFYDSAKPLIPGAISGMENVIFSVLCVNNFVIKEKLEVRAEIWIIALTHLICD